MFHGGWAKLANPTTSWLSLSPRRARHHKGWSCLHRILLKTIFTSQQHRQPASHQYDTVTQHRYTTSSHKPQSPIRQVEMCIIDSGRALRREDDYYAPRPVSNFHGGPPRQRGSRPYIRRLSSSVPQRITYRNSYRESNGRVYEPATVTRVSRTYVR